MGKYFVSRMGAWVVTAVALAFVTPLVASAQPGPPPGAKERREERKERREDRREKREEAREETREEHKDLREARKDLAEARHGGASSEELRARARDVVEARKDLNTARRKARDAAKGQIKARIERAKGNVNRPALTAELRRHARTTARLARAREVAEQANQTAAVERIDGLMVKETARHNRWLDNHAPEK